MGTVDDYLASLAHDDRAAIDRVYALALEVVPDAVQGLGYGMPALTYRRRPLISSSAPRSTSASIRSAQQW